jgi:hypothetical protein
MTYNTFLSWSGENSLSYRVAKLFKDRLHMFNPHCEPFLSNQDLRPGLPFDPEIKRILNGCKSIIVFLTERSIKSPWLNFETGIFAANHEQIMALEIGNIEFNGSPIDRNQWKKPIRDDIYFILREINIALDAAINERTVEDYFNREWEEFNNRLIYIINEEGEYNFILNNQPLELRINQGEPSLSYNGAEQLGNDLWRIDHNVNNENNVYGPYIPLGRGNYKVTYHLTVERAIREDQKFLEINIAKTVGDQHPSLTSKQLSKRNIEMGQAFITFTLHSMTEGIELRLKMLNAENSIIFSHLILEKIT